MEITFSVDIRNRWELVFEFSWHRGRKYLKLNIIMR